MEQTLSTWGRSMELSMQSKFWVAWKARWRRWTGEAGVIHSPLLGLHGPQTTTSKFVKKIEVVVCGLKFKICQTGGNVRMWAHSWRGGGGERWDAMSLGRRSWGCWPCRFEGEETDDSSGRDRGVPGNKDGWWAIGFFGQGSCLKQGEVHL